MHCLVCIQMIQHALSDTRRQNVPNRFQIDLRNCDVQLTASCSGPGAQRLAFERSIKESCVSHSMSLLVFPPYEICFFQYKMSNKISKTGKSQLVSSPFLRLQCCHLMDTSLRKIRLGLSCQSYFCAPATVGFHHIPKSEESKDTG